MAERIGQIFLRRKLISGEQLDKALREQAQNGKFLGEILIGHGSVTEQGLLETLAEQFNTRFVILEQAQINPLIERIVPKTLVMEYSFMPIEIKNAVLLMAVSNPLDMWPMSVVQEKMNLAEVQTVLATKEDIRRTIEKYYGPEMRPAK